MKIHAKNILKSGAYQRAVCFMCLCLALSVLGCEKPQESKYKSVDSVVFENVYAKEETVSHVRFDDAPRRKVEAKERQIHFVEREEPKRATRRPRDESSEIVNSKREVRGDRALQKSPPSRALPNDFYDSNIGVLGSAAGSKPAPRASIKRRGKRTRAAERAARTSRSILPEVRVTTPISPDSPDSPEEHPAHQSGQFQHYGVNKMTETAADPLSTFGADVDTGSYTLARRVLNEGSLPPAESVRVEEYLNYFYYSYPDPDEGAFGVHLEAAPSPFIPANNRKILRIGVQGKRVTRSTRKPAHLTFLVDVSGSMWGPDRIDLVKKALKILTLNLHEEDTVAISTYASGSEILLEPTTLKNRELIMEAIDKLYARGSTNMSSGLKLAYELASQSYEEGHTNRVIVLTDGDANVGATSHTRALSEIQEYVDKGITLSAIGFGMGNLREVMMEQLANKGNGNYYYLDTEAEARKVFGEQLDGTLQVIAKDVKFQVEFNPEAVTAFRLIGYENRTLAHEDFADDSVDSGDIGGGHTVTALYEVVLSDAALDGELDEFAKVRVRHKEPDGKASSEQVFDFTRADLHPTLADSSQDFQFAAAVAGFAEVLRESPYARELKLSLVAELAQSGALPEEKMRQEFVGLVQKAAALQKD